MVAWILLCVVSAPVVAITVLRLRRVRQISQPTVADPERLGEELLDYVARQGRRVVDLRPFWDTRQLSEADRWAIQGPLLQSGRLIPAGGETRSLLGRIRVYIRARLPEHVVLAK